MFNRLFILFYNIEFVLLTFWMFLVLFVSGADEEASGPHRDVSSGERPRLI